MHINKTTTIGAVAACAVIGATSPVWADSGGSNTSTELSPAQQAAVISTLRAEIAKLKAEFKSDEAALRAATKAARLQAHALHKARLTAAHRTQPATQTVPVQDPTTVTPSFSRSMGDNENENEDFAGSSDGYPSDQHSGYHGDYRGHEGRSGDDGEGSYGDHGDYGDHGNYGDNGNDGGDGNSDD